MLIVEQYRELEQAIAQKHTYLEALKNDPELQRELAFDAALEAFLAQHSMNKHKLHLFLRSDPSVDFYKKPVAAKGKATRNSHPEPTKTFRNPHSGEILTVKRLSHSTYKQWVAEHGEATVQSWLIG